MRQKCMDQEGATQEDADSVLKHLKSPESRAQKCFLACIFEHGRTSDGKRFVTEVFLEKGEKFAGNDQERLHSVREAAERCDGVENDDRCELAAEIVACLKDS
uniref:(northern house mosquito) hypothetical protein n=1 Tax=Culex pipiens TaxID=7175 RepID=A0A8D8FH58_CULPI